MTLAQAVFTSIAIIMLLKAVNSSSVKPMRTTACEMVECSQAKMYS